MRPSLLHLEGYYLKELSVTLNEAFTKKAVFGSWVGYHYQPDKSFTVEPPEFDVYREIGTKVDDPTSLRYVLKIRSVGAKDKVPYSFKISLVGFFHVDKSLKEDDAKSLVYANAPSVLFSAAREALSSVTARGPYPAVVLPLVSFHDDAEQLAATDAKRVGPRLLKARPAKKGATRRHVRKVTTKK